jgi:hypothetical protein
MKSLFTFTIFILLSLNLYGGAGHNRSIYSIPSIHPYWGLYEYVNHPECQLYLGFGSYGSIHLAQYPPSFNGKYISFVLACLHLIITYLFIKWYIKRRKRKLLILQEESHVT